MGVGLGARLDAAATVAIRHALPGILRDFQITTLLDAPCGDFHWMKEVNISWIQCIGVPSGGTVLSSGVAASLCPTVTFTQTFPRSALIHARVTHLGRQLTTSGQQRNLARTTEPRGITLIRLYIASTAALQTIMLLRPILLR